MPLEQAQLFFGKEGVWDVIEMKVKDPDRVGDYPAPCARPPGPAPSSSTGATSWPPSGAR